VPRSRHLSSAACPRKTCAEKLAFYDVKTKAFVVEPGAFEALVGNSSEDVRLKGRFEVSAQAPLKK